MQGSLVETHNFSSALLAPITRDWSAEHYCPTFNKWYVRHQGSSLVLAPNPTLVSPETVSRPVPE